MRSGIGAEQKPCATMSTLGLSFQSCLFLVCKLVGVSTGSPGGIRGGPRTFFLMRCLSGRLRVPQKSKSIYCFGKSAPWTYSSI